MDRALLESICKQIYRRFPEVKGSQPKVRPYEASHSLLIFQGKGVAADGKSISHVVRVVVNQDGKIKKVTTSR